MDVIVTGRHCTISDAFRDQVTERLASVEKLKDRLIRAEVQVTVNESKRQPDQTVNVEITLIGKGPVIRAEAWADEKVVAFEHAFDRLKSQVRKAADRRKTYRGLRTPAPLQPVGAGAAASAPYDLDEPLAEIKTVAGLEVHGDGPLVVREKHVAAVPLTLAQALDEMELVGHDFFLYVDAQTNNPSVVYRRKAYDYGVIHLEVEAVD